MPGLIEEIQRDALDSRVSIDGLLRRVKLAAAKLQLDNLEEWVEQELNGYSGELPAYRRVLGQPAAWNPYNGWIPVYTNDHNFMSLISEARISQSVASLGDLVHFGKGENLHFPLPPQLVASLNELLSHPTPRVIIQLGRGSIISILDTVRNMALNWAIKMEKQGVLGSELSFDSQERTKAQNVMSSFHVGNIETFVGNLGFGNNSGSIVSSKSTTTKISELIQQIEKALPELANEGVDATVLKSIIADIKQQIAGDSAEPTKLKSLLCDARAVLVGAVGNLASEGALALISSALNLLHFIKPRERNSKQKRAAGTRHSGAFEFDRGH